MTGAPSAAVYASVEPAGFHWGRNIDCMLCELEDMWLRMSVFLRSLFLVYCSQFRVENGKRVFVVG